MALKKKLRSDENSAGTYSKRIHQITWKHLLSVRNEDRIPPELLALCCVDDGVERGVGVGDGQDPEVHGQVEPVGAVDQLKIHVQLWSDTHGLVRVVLAYCYGSARQIPVPNFGSFSPNPASLVAPSSWVPQDSLKSLVWVA